MQCYSSHIRLLSALDWSWVVNSNNGLHANGHPHWLQLQLAAAKLLYLAVQLPADTLPQFQMLVQYMVVLSCVYLYGKFYFSGIGCDKVLM